MITYRNLGRVGRLVNALFELAATIGIGLDYGEEVVLPEDWLHRPFFSVPDELFGPVPAEARESTEFVHHMDKRALPYLQDVNLFLPYLNVIKGYLQPSQRAMEVLSQYELPPGPRLGVHVRRGDNVFDPGVPNKADYHICPDVSYYHRAVAALQVIAKVVCISDDIPWCREYIRADFYGDGRAYLKEHEEAFGKDAPYDWIDLFLLSRCNYFVITGSTFGIWGALLSDAQPHDVVRPNRVYGPKVAAYTNSEIMFHPDWRVVPC